MLILEPAAAIALQAGKKQEGTALIERILQQYRKVEFRRPKILAAKCRDAGWHQQAIDLYLQGDYQAYEDALDIALLHLPERVGEIAEKGFNEYDKTVFFIFNQIYYQCKPSFYLACAGILGKVEEARRRLREPAEPPVQESPEIAWPSAPDGFKETIEEWMKTAPKFPEIPALDKIQALVKLGEQNAARTLVERTEQSLHTHVAAFNDFYPAPALQQLGELYAALGNTEKAKDMYRTEIDSRLRFFNAEEGQNILARIDEIYTATNDPSILENKQYLLNGLEEKADYQQAARLAEKMGKAELVETYRTMQQLVEEAA